MLMSFGREADKLTGSSLAEACSVKSPETFFAQSAKDR
jgi:hypothetical protein